MTDEKYAFIQDVKEKAQTGRSSHNRRTHAGKGGAVRLPSDNLKRKELKAMNGDVICYRLNDPMKWKEFKKMPDKLKIDYITAIRSKFGATDTAIAEMLGVTAKPMYAEFKKLGIAGGSKNGWRKWDKEGFEKWAHGETAEQSTTPEIKRLPVMLDPLEEPQPVLPVPAVAEPARAVPTSGSLIFTGEAEEIFNVVAQFLRGGAFKIAISWERVNAEGASADG